MRFDLASSLALRDLPEPQVRQTLTINSGGVREDVSYEGLENVTELYNPAAFPGRVFVRDGRVQMIYLPRDGGLDDLTPADLESQLDSSYVELRSRAGKRFRHRVHPDLGVAYSASGDAIAFVEIFSPRSIQAYQAEIYREPPPFKR